MIDHDGRQQEAGALTFRLSPNASPSQSPSGTMYATEPRP